MPFLGPSKTEDSDNGPATEATKMKIEATARRKAEIEAARKLANEILQKRAPLASLINQRQGDVSVVSKQIEHTNKQDDVSKTDKMEQDVSKQIGETNEAGHVSKQIRETSEEDNGVKRI